MSLELNKIYNGESLEVLKTFPDKSINCCVTSPPYWSLRNYGVDGQLGLEPTFDAYINRLCDIFDEVKRVLRDDGTCWVNIGDTYSGSGVGQIDTGKASYEGKDFRKEQTKTYLEDKSLCNIPARFSIEMQNRGWILRNVIIWYKPNCMPSSVKDRFTVDFEYVFFFVKKKKYWFEQQLEHFKSKNNQPEFLDKKFIGKENNISIKNSDYLNPKGRNKRTVWKVNTKSYKEAHFATYPKDLIEPMIKAGCPVNGVVLDPFIGSGTTAEVALEQNKNYVGIELNKDYIELANKRLEPLKKQTKLF